MHAYHKTAFARVMLCALAGVGLLAVTKDAAAQAAPNCELPDILVLLDISGSMADRITLPDGTTDKKINQAVQGVLSSVKTLQAKAKFGLMVFPRPNLGSEVYGYCEVTQAAAVPFAQGDAAAFTDYLATTGVNYFGGPQGTYDTPIYQALEQARNLRAFSAPGRHFVILITDGMQDCRHAGDFNAIPDGPPTGSYLYPDEAENNRQLIAALAGDMKATSSVTVYPVGFSAGTDALNLNGIAHAAGTERMDGCNYMGTVPGALDNCYYHADNGSELVTALQQVVKRIETEICDGLDNDCDGVVDNAPAGGTLSQACTSSCGLGSQTCDAVPGSGMPAWTTCTTPNVAPETCNNIDDNCDGNIDEGLTRDCSNCLGAGSSTCIAGKWLPCNAPTLTADSCTPSIIAPSTPAPSPPGPPPATPPPTSSVSGVEPTSTNVVPPVTQPSTDVNKRVTIQGGCGCQDTPPLQGLLGLSLVAMIAFLPGFLRRRSR